MQIEQQVLDFFQALRENNSKQWMDANRTWYSTVKENIKSFSQALEQRINEVDVIERVKISRINRDIRFSPTKTCTMDFMWCH